MKNSGYTLVELIIVMAITAIIMAALLFFFSGSITSYRSQVGHIFATADARNQVQRITDVIRNTQDKTSNDWLQEKEDDAIAIYTDVEGDRVLEKVAYRRSTTNEKQLVREVTVADGTVTTSIVMRDIANDTQPLFVYYDANGKSISKAADRTSLTVKNIGVTISVGSYNTQDTDLQIVSSRITPRSKLQGDVSQIEGPVATREVSVQLPRGTPPSASASATLVTKDPSTGATSSKSVSFAQLNDGRLSVYANKLYAILNYKTNTGLGNNPGWYVWIAKSVPTLNNLYPIPLATLYTNQCLGVSFGTVQASTISSCVPLDTALYPISAVETFQPIITYTENGKRDYVRDITIPALLPPVAYTRGGNHSSAQSVDLSAEAGAAIRYTLDGSDPIITSTLYVSTISISTSKTLKAIAVDTAGNISLIMTEVYMFALANGPNAIDLIGEYVNETDNPLVPLYSKNTRNDGQAAVNQYGFYLTAGIALDSTFHRLFIGDYNNNRVLVYNLSVGNLLADRIPDYVLGQTDFNTGIASLVDQARLYNQSGLVFDSVNNRLYVADSDKNRVLIFNTATITNGENAVNVLGQTDFALGGAADSQPGMRSPIALALDSPNNRLYVAQSGGLVPGGNHRVTVYDTSTITNGENAVNILGQTAFNGTSFSTTQSGMNIPRGLAFDSTNSRLFVSEHANRRVLVYNTSTITNGMNAVNVLGQTSFGSNSAVASQSGMNSPFGLTFDPTIKRLYVADWFYHRVAAFNTSSITNGMNALFVLGQATFNGRNSALTQSGLNYPQAIVLDPTTKRLYVADSSNNRIMVFCIFCLLPPVASPPGGTYSSVQSVALSEEAGAAIRYTLDGSDPIITSTLYVSTISISTSKTLKAIAVDTDGNVSSIMTEVYTFPFANGDPAIDLLGQYDQTSFTNPVPVYTKGGYADGANIFGFGAGGIALDLVHHRLFIADNGNRRVLVFNLTASNLLPDRFPDYVLGQSNFYAINTSVSAFGLNGNVLAGLAYDSVGNRLFVADASVNRVLVYDVASIANGESAVNVLGQANFTASNPGTSQNGMNFPRDLVYDSANSRLFVADGSNSRVLVYDVASIADGESAVSVLGQTGFTTATAAITQSGLTSPLGLAYSSVGTRLFVVDTPYPRVLVYNVASIVDGENAVSVLGQTGFSTTTAATSISGMRKPYGLAYDGAGNRLFVSDNASLTNRVTVYDVASITNGESAVSVLGEVNFTSSNAGVTQPGMQAPLFLAHDSTNNRLFVEQGGRITTYDVASITNGENAVDVLGVYDQSSFTNPVPVYSKGGGNDAPNIFGFYDPTDIALDMVNHRLFVSDTDFNRVLVYNLNTDNTIPDRIPDKVLGQPNFYSFPPAGSPYTASKMHWPKGLAYDSARNLLFVADQFDSRVLVYDVASIANGESAVKVLGQTNFTTMNVAVSQSGMGYPNSLAYDSANQRLFVVEGEHSLSTGRITVFDVASITNGENAVSVLGQPNFITLSPATTQSGVNEPNAIAFSSGTNRLFVSDRYNNRVLVFDVASITNGESAVNVLGQAGFTTNSSARTQSTMYYPGGLESDDGNSMLYVSDTNNSRVLMFNVASIADGEDAVNVLGQVNFTGSGGGTTQSKVSFPRGLVLDSANTRLYVVDTSNNRVMIFDVP